MGGGVQVGCTGFGEAVHIGVGIGGGVQVGVGIGGGVQVGGDGTGGLVGSCVGVLVSVGVGVWVRTRVGVLVSVCVGVPVGVRVGVCVSVCVGVPIAGRVDVPGGVSVSVGAAVGAFVQKNDPMGPRPVFHPRANMPRNTTPIRANTATRHQLGGNAPLCLLSRSAG